MQSINLSIVTTSNFAPLLAQISTLEARLKSLNALTATAGSGFTSAQAVAQLKSLQKAYHETMMASKGFQSTTFTATTTAQLLSKRLATNTLSALDYRNALRSVTNQSNLFNLVGQRQIAVQNSNLLVTGKTATAYTALAVDMTNATIKSQVYTQAILAQKAALSQLAVNLVNAGKNMQWAGRQLTAGLTMPVAMIGAASAAMFNTVDKNLTRLSKVYGVGLMQPTVSELQRVRKEVIGLSTELGASLGISAKEVTDIAAQFAAAGLTGKTMLEATKQASRMVVLGEADKQQAINATISLQTAYKLNTNQLTEAVNFFNAAQAATSTNMADLIEAIPKAGPVIQGMGGSVKDLALYLTAMREGGIAAAEGANALKSSLASLINPTKKASDMLAGMGININEASADFKIMEGRPNTFVINMTAGAAASLQKLPQVKEVSFYVDNIVGNTFPNDIAHAPWSVDNYGAIQIPKKGDIIQLNDSTIEIYRRLITNYEHNSLEKQNGQFYINGKPTNTYTVQLNYYWMMGDNRHRSQDSRYWGFVPETHIVGRAALIWFSYNKSIRWNRLFNLIK